MSGHERTGWRDEDLSRRHRLWGFNCPAVDVDAMLAGYGEVRADFALVEYDHKEPKAFIDYKHWKKERPFKRDANMEAFGRAGARAKLPALYVRYGGGEWLDDPHWRGPWCDWWVLPVNDIAGECLRASFGKAGLVKLETEVEYVAFLYRLRGREMPGGVAERLRWVALLEQGASRLKWSLEHGNPKTEASKVVEAAVVELRDAIAQFDTEVSRLEWAEIEPECAR